MEAVRYFSRLADSPPASPPAPANADPGIYPAAPAAAINPPPASMRLRGNVAEAGMSTPPFRR
jgi:hypothetical protein